MDQYTTEKDIAKKNDPKTLLVAAFHEYRQFLEPGDADLIAKGCGETKRNVQEYLRGNVSSIETGKKIFAATRALIVEREKSVKVLVGVNQQPSHIVTK